MAGHCRADCILYQRICRDGSKRTGKWISERTAARFGRIWHREQPDQQNRDITAIMLFTNDERKRCKKKKAKNCAAGGKGCNIVPEKQSY